MKRSAYLELMRYLRDLEIEEGRTIESFAMEGRQLPGGDVQILLDCEFEKGGGSDGNE